MRAIRPVRISTFAFRFCRIGVAVLLWLSIMIWTQELLLVVTLIFAFSLLLGVHRSPMIVLGTLIEQSWTQKAPMSTVDVPAMRFAHAIGLVFSLGAFIISFALPQILLGYLLIFSSLKTLSAFGVCPADKIYSCTKNGCCSLRK